MKKVSLTLAFITLIACLLLSGCNSVTPESLMKEGKYSEAYEMAETEDKNKILAENVIACLSMETSEKLKNPSSFVLRDAYHKTWIDDDGKIAHNAILYVTATNSFGGAISTYYVWTSKPNGTGWTYFGSASSMEEDDDDDLAEKLVKITMKSIIEDAIQLEREQVKNINDQFKADTLYLVKLIDSSLIDTSLIDKE